VTEQTYDRCLSLTSSMSTLRHYTTAEDDPNSIGLR
jgi:hypothetical protein